MKTSLVPTGGAGGQRASRLRQASETMEMGLSNLGTDERKTRTGYKDQMKKKAFDLIAHAASNLCLLYTSPSPRDGLLSRMPSSA